VTKLGRISDFSNIVAYGHKLWRPVAASSPSVTYQLVWLPVMNNSGGFLPQTEPRDFSNVVASGLAAVSFLCEDLIILQHWLAWLPRQAAATCV